MSAPFRKRVRKIVDETLANSESYEGALGHDLARLWTSFIKPYRTHVLAAVLLTGLLACQQPAFAMTWRFLVDKGLRVTEGIDASRMGFHKQLVLLFFAINMGIWLISLIAVWTKSYFIHLTGQRLAFALRRALHEKLQELHIGFFEQTSSGRILSRVLGDVNVVLNWSTQHVLDLLGQLFTIVAGCGMMLYLNWKLALLIILVMPFYAYVFARFRPAVKRHNVALRRMNSSLYGYASERVKGISVVQAFGRELGECRRFAGGLANMIRVQMSLVDNQQALGMIATVTSTLLTCTIIYFGFSSIRDGHLTLGSALAFLQVMPPVFQGVNMLTAKLVAVQGALVCLRRIFLLLDEPVEVQSGRIRLTGMVGHIQLKDVTFNYPNQMKPSLQHVSLDIAPGERIAIMGPSGAGKSTLFQLLLRFYDPTEGHIRIGGVDLTAASSNSLRRHVRMVQQEPVVFSGTLAQNIMYGLEDATPSQVITAATHAELHELIMSLPLKYETEVGEQGMTLSGGQRQRLALATALLTNPEILLLDDTTSALDARTETRIRETLNHVLRGRTSLTITQRAATAMHADRIIVIEHGRITQRGTHAQLVEAEGFYQEVCRQQDITE